MSLAAGSSRASLVVSINAVNADCLNDITESLTAIILDHLSHPGPETEEEAGRAPNALDPDNYGGRARRRGRANARIRRGM